jgi:hypothetical protein
MICRAEDVAGARGAEVRQDRPVGDRVGHGVQETK